MKHRRFYQVSSFAELRQDRCSKRGYRTRQDAEQVLDAMVESGAEDFQHLNAYFCRRGCRLWHVGHRYRFGSNGKHTRRLRK